MNVSILIMIAAIGSLILGFLMGSTIMSKSFKDELEEESAGTLNFIEENDELMLYLDLKNKPDELLRRRVVIFTINDKVIK